jgi:Beta-ketoacyl synthase, N-terminal domain
MKTVTVQAVGICAAGLRDWPSASRVLAGSADFELDPPPNGPLEWLPQTERRRINETSRLACLAASEALAALGPGVSRTIPAIFTSADGDGVVLAQLLSSLAQREVVVSPTAFHNSVYNAPAGYWTIASRSTAPCTTVCADSSSFAVALLEGYVQAITTGASVLFVAAYVPFPEAIRALGRSTAAFACALVLTGAPAGIGASIEGWRIGAGSGRSRGSVEISAIYGDNAAAAALPLLRALASGDDENVALPYLDGAWLELEVVA